MSEMPNEEMVEMELDLSDAELLKLALMAHERDITLNQMIRLLLEEVVKSYEDKETQEPEDDDAPNVL